jgi:hypothetical protein
VTIFDQNFSEQYEIICAKKNLSRGLNLFFETKFSEQKFKI